MRLIPNAVASLLLPLFIVLLPATLTGCGGGDRYSCDSCGEGEENNPDETDSEDPAEILPLSFIEAAKFSIVDAADPAALDDFDNFFDIDLRIGTISEAAETEYDDENDGSNIAGIGGERWNDSVQTLAWGETTSDLDDSKQRQYYQLTSDVWTLNTDQNNHELRRYDDKVYDFWLGVTIKWEIYEAKDRQNSSGVNYPSIAGKNMDEVLLEFVPPILADPIALQSVQLWGENIPFSDTADAEARIFVVYKQFRPITLEGDPDTAVVNAGFLAFVPAPANDNGTAFEFKPLSSTVEPDTFKTEFSGLTTTARFAINGRLYASFNISGTEGAGGNGVILWESRQTEFQTEFADYEQVDFTNGSYIRIIMTPEQKLYYGLETYENPLIAFIEDTEGDAINYGAHLGWYYVPSATLDVDKPQPHYAFNGTAIADIQTAFSTWRREKYCEDNDHDQDAGRDAICSGTIAP